MIVQCVVFELNCIQFFQEHFLEANYLGLVTGQKVLEFFMISPDSSAVSLYESWAACFELLGFIMMEWVFFSFCFWYYLPLLFSFFLEG